MSMTKRYLESLPQSDQDAILGPPPGEWEYGEYETVPQIFCKPDETAPAVSPACDGCGELFPASALWNGICADCQIKGLENGELVYAVNYTEADEADREWAESLADETADKFTERDEAPLIKRQPKGGVKAGPMDV